MTTRVAPYEKRRCVCRRLSRDSSSDGWTGFHRVFLGSGARRVRGSRVSHVCVSVDEVRDGDDGDDGVRVASGPRLASGVARVVPARTRRPRRPGAHSPSSPSRRSLAVLVVLLLRDEVGGADGGGGDLREGAGSSRVSPACTFHARGRCGVSTVAAPRTARGATGEGRREREKRGNNDAGDEAARERSSARDAPSRPQNRTRGGSCPCTTSSRRLPCRSRVGGAESKAGVSRGCVVRLAGTGRSKTAYPCEEVRFRPGRPRHFRGVGRFGEPKRDGCCL